MLMAEETQTAPKEAQHRTLSGDVVERGISKQSAEIAENLRWMFRYMTEKRLTLSDVARLLNVDASCVSRVFRGTYTGLNNQILPPPSKMLAAIDEIRKAERARMRNRRDRVKTPTVQKNLGHSQQKRGTHKGRNGGRGREAACLFHFREFAYRQNFGGKVV